MKKLKSSYILSYLRKIDIMIKKAIVCEGLQYGDKQKAVALLVKGLIKKFDDVTTSKLIYAAILKKSRYQKVATADVQQITQSSFQGL